MSILGFLGFLLKIYPKSRVLLRKKLCSWFRPWCRKQNLHRIMRLLMIHGGFSVSLYFSWNSTERWLLISIQMMAKQPASHHQSLKLQLDPKPHNLTTETWSAFVIPAVENWWLLKSDWIPKIWSRKTIYRIYSHPKVSYPNHWVWSLPTFINQEIFREVGSPSLRDDPGPKALAWWLTQAKNTADRNGTNAWNQGFGIESLWLCLTQKPVYGWQKQGKTQLSLVDISILKVSTFEQKIESVDIRWYFTCQQRSSYIFPLSKFNLFDNRHKRVVRSRELQW